MDALKFLKMENKTLIDQVNGIDKTLVDQVNDILKRIDTSGSQIDNCCIAVTIGDFKRATTDALTGEHVIQQRNFGNRKSAGIDSVACNIGR